MGNGHGVESLPIQTEGRTGLENLQNEVGSISKILLEEWKVSLATDTVADTMCGKQPDG